MLNGLKQSLDHRQQITKKPALHTSYLRKPLNANSFAIIRQYNTFAFCLTTVLTPVHSPKNFLNLCIELNEACPNRSAWMQQYEYTFLAELSDYFWDSVDRVQCTQENAGLTKRLPYLTQRSQKDSPI